MLGADPQPAPDGDPCLRTVRRQPRPCPSRMECQRALDCSEEDHTASDRMAEQERDGGIAEGSPAQDPARPNRIRLLLFLYNSGARVSEATRLQAKDLQIQRRDGGHALVTLHGKGGRLRQCPLWPRTERVLAQLVRGRAAEDAVFLSRHRRPYTRFGVYRLVERCAARVPALDGRKITPHVVRHTSACALVRAGVDLNTIRAWLGHVSLDTTNIYAEIDLEMKAKAMALCDATEPEPDRPWKENRGLIAFLNAM